MKADSFLLNNIVQQAKVITGSSIIEKSVAELLGVVGTKYEPSAEVLTQKIRNGELFFFRIISSYGLTLQAICSGIET